MNITAAGFFQSLLSSRTAGRHFITACVAAAVTFVTLGAGTSARADAASELAAFPGFKDVKVESLTGGEIKAVPSPLMRFSRGISVQTAFVIQGPVKDVARGIASWSGVRHGDLKVYLHEGVSKGGFAKIGTLSNSSYKNFLKASGQGTSGVQVSKAEAEELRGPDGPGAWSKILQARASGGGSGVYDTAGGAITARGDARSLINDNPFLSKQFPSLVGLPPGSPYWEFFDVQGTGAVNIGSITSKAGAGGSVQILDWQYYASGGFYTNIIFYQLWPVQVNGKEATLVWRGDFLSVPDSANSRGMERLAATMIMLQEIKKVASYLQQDLKK